MTREEIISGVNEVMAGGFEIEPALLKPESRLIEDLGLDSLDGVDLVVAVEKRFDCRLEESRVRELRTLGDVYDYCASLAVENDGRVSSG